MPVPTTKNATPRVLLREVVFDRLLDAIVEGDLAPGEILRDYEIEQWAGASRTPVREAIDRLGSLGFVDILPQKETRVAAIDTGRFSDQLETLQALTVGTIPDAVPLLDDADLADIIAQIDLLRRPGGAESDTPVVISDLLATFLRVYGNTVTIRIRDSLMPHIRRAINARGDDVTYFMSNDELDEMLTAVSTRDASATADIVDGYFSRLVAGVRNHAAVDGKN